MRRIALSVLLVSALALAILNLSGCETNIFEWAEEEEKGHMDRGLELMSEEKYAEAAEEFKKAMDENPNNADARYYHAKATLLASGFNILTLGQEMAKVQAAPGVNMPFMTWPTDSANTLYQANLTICDDLRPIFYGQATGNIGREDIRIDYTIASGINSILSFRDTDGNGTIDSQDFDLDILTSTDPSEYSIDNLDGLKDHLLADTGNDTAQTVDMANGMISRVDSLSTEAIEALDVETLVAGGDTLGFDPADLDSVSSSITETADSYYLYYIYGGPESEGEGDNDGDWTVTDDLNNNGRGDSDYDGQPGVDDDGDGSIDEEVLDGTDDDGDGLIDEDCVSPADANGDGNPLWDPEPNVDEETIDGQDDDGDGLIDEDSHL